MEKRVIEGARIFNGRLGAQLEQLDLMVEGDRIADLGLPGSFSALEDPVQCIDGRDKSIIPGLIDCHVHLFQDCTPFPDPIATLLTEPSELTMIRGVKNCRRYLEAGVTTVRDLGTRRERIFILQKALDVGLIPGPRIQASGDPITIPGGAGDFMSFEVEGIDAIERTTRTLAQSGVQVIKILNTGLLHNPLRASDIPHYSVEEIRACVAVAEEFGLKVAAHAHGGYGIRNAVLGGVNDISHGVYLNEELGQLMIDLNCYFVPTVNSGMTLLEHIDHPVVSEYTRGRAARVTEIRLKNLSRAIDMEVPIAAGSDDATEWNFHGNLWRELLTYVELGMSTDQAIASATSVAAECLGLSKIIGTVEKGKIADLVLVNGDPLKNLETLKSPCMVIQNGTVVYDRNGAQIRI